MNSGLKKVFWGVFIATFNVNMGTIRILPAFIGWILVAVGILEIQKNSKTVKYNLPKWISFILIGVALLDDVLKILGQVQNSPFIVLMFFPIILMIIEFLLFHNLLEAIVQSLNANKLKEVSDLYIEKHKTYILLAAMAVLSAASSFFINLEMLGVFTRIFVIITRVYLLIIFINLNKENWGKKD